MTAMSNREEKFFAKAREISHSSIMKRARIGCIMVSRGKVVSTGINSFKTHPVQGKYDKYRSLHVSNDCSKLHSMHAEIACLIALKKDVDMSRVELFIYRDKLNANGERIVGMARPCPACMHLIKDMGIKCIHYSTDDGYAVEYLDV